MIAGGAALVVMDVLANRTGDHGTLGPWTLVAVLTEGAVYVGTGLVAMTKRPDSRVGLLMSIAGFVLLLQWIGLSNAALPFTFATVWMPPLVNAVIAQVILTFPSGRIGGWIDRVLIGAAYLLGLVIQPSTSLFLDPQTTYCPACPRDLILVRSDLHLADALSIVNTWLAAAVAFGILLLLARRWWKATPAGRRVSAVPLWVGLALTVEFIVVSFLPLSFFGVGFYPSEPQTFLLIDAALTSAYPVAFLIGLLRTGWPGRRSATWSSSWDGARWPARRSATRWPIGSATPRWSWCIGSTRRMAGSIVMVARRPCRSTTRDAPSRCSSDRANRSRP